MRSLDTGTDWRAAFEDALALDGRGEIAAAVARLDAAAAAIPDAPGPLKFAGQLYQRLGADAQSFALLSRALALAPEDADLHLALGYHHVDNGALDTALICFRRHLALDSESQMGRMYLGRTLDWLGRFDEAETELAAAVALDPGVVEPQLQLGRVRLHAGRFDAAREAFDAVDTLAPGDVLAEIGRRRAAALAERSARQPASTAAPAAVVCVKAGIKYGPDYVNRLAAMVRRHTTRMPRFVCFTDDTSGLGPDIETHPLPADGLAGWWNKVALFRRDLPGVTGRVLYLDLDVVIVGALDPLLTFDSAFAVMENDYVPGFNSSVMLFEAGGRPELWGSFTPETAATLKGDQDWLGLMAPDADLWPAGWCVPFRLRAAQAIPDGARIVVFSGRPNPDDYPAPWVKEHWR